MNHPAPHFLLLAETGRKDGRDEWSFVLEAADGSAIQSAQEHEPTERGERLELLSVVRGLEALDQPSRVTLVTRSKYVRRGIAYGLDEWRSSGWTWECFGEMVPVKNRDLWQRLDRAMQFHQIELRAWRLDPPHAARSEQAAPRRSSIPAPHFLNRGGWEPVSADHSARVETDGPSVEPTGHVTRRQVDGSRRRWRHTLARFGRASTELRSWLWLKLARLGTSVFPHPWLEERTITR